MTEAKIEIVEVEPEKLPQGVLYTGYAGVSVDMAVRLYQKRHGVPAEKVFVTGNTILIPLAESFARRFWKRRGRVRRTRSACWMGANGMKHRGKGADDGEV